MRPKIEKVVWNESERERSWSYDVNGHAYEECKGIL